MLEKKKKKHAIIDFVSCNSCRILGLSNIYLNCKLLSDELTATLETNPASSEGTTGLHEDIVAQDATSDQDEVTSHSSMEVMGEQELAQIWEELGVGQNGFLTLDELHHVCSHIGMEEMGPEVHLL